MSFRKQCAGRCASALEFLGGRGRIVLALAATLVAAQQLHAQFSVQPVIVTATPVDSALVAVVTVRNQSAVEKQYHFSFADFDQDVDGGHSFHPLGSNAASCNGRVRVSPSGTTLLPGERAAIRLTLSAADRECWGVLLVEEDARGTVRGLRAGSQIAVKLYLTTPRSTLDASIGSVTSSIDTAGVHVTFEMRNSGSAPMRPQGRAEIRTPAGDAIGATEVEAFSILPGHSRRMHVTVAKQLPPGKYVIVPILDFGGSFLAGGQGLLTVP